MKNLLIEEVNLLGITSNSPNFIPGPFSKSLLQSEESIDIDIMFIPRLLDYMEGLITVETSAGIYSFIVYGIGIHNPFLVTPLIDRHISTEVPLNVDIELFNPYNEILHIKDLFTSGGFIDPHFSKDTPPEFWRINPYEKKSVIPLNFTHHKSSKYRGLVNIVTKNEYIITIPIEIEIHNNEIFKIPSYLDLGVHTSKKHELSKSISLLNSQIYPVLVTSIKQIKYDPYTKIKFTPIILNPGITTQIATITHISHYNRENFNGTLVINTNDTNHIFSEFNIDYFGSNIWGDIQYSIKDVSFLIKQFPTQESRVLSLVHHFTSPIKIYNAEISSDSFRIMHCSKNELILPNTPWSGINIQFSGIVYPILDGSNHILSISTNISVIEIPLLPYNGRLEFEVLDQDIDTQKADFGILALNDIVTRVVNVSNPNPLDININSINILLPRIQARLEGIYNQFGAKVDNYDIQKNTLKHLTLESYHHALFILQVQCTVEELAMGIFTFQYNDVSLLEIPIFYHCMKGSLNLQPSVLQFSPSFPGRIDHKSIIAKSTYTKPITIQSILSPDPRIITTITNSVIPPGKRMEIAQVYFNPSLGPNDENYMVSFPSKVLQPSQDDAYALQLDKNIMTHRDNIWNRILSDGNDIIQGNLIINTDVINGHTIPVKAPLYRPSITKESFYQFPLTQIGETADMMLPVYNPSNHPLQVQMYSIKSSTEFLFPENNEKPEIIPPRSVASIGPIYFLPQSFIQSNISLYLKNNLTVLESVSLRGKGGSGTFTLTKDKDTENTIDSLKFEITSKQMENCNNSKPLIETTSVIGINKGNLPTNIYGLSINYGGCSDSGFRVSPCGPFILQPKEQIKINISFTPDFSSSIVERSLIVSTAQGDIIFPLEAELPYEWLSVCADSQPLSILQQNIRQVIIIISLFIFIIFCLYLLYEIYSTKVYKNNNNNSIPNINQSSDSIKIDNKISTCSLKIPKKLELPNDDHFIDEIDDFVANLPQNTPKKLKTIDKIEEKQIQKQIDEDTTNLKKNIKQLPASNSNINTNHKKEQKIQNENDIKNTEKIEKTEGTNITVKTNTNGKKKQKVSPVSIIPTKVLEDVNPDKSKNLTPPIEKKRENKVEQILNEKQTINKNIPTLNPDLSKKDVVIIDNSINFQKPKKTNTINKKESKSLDSVKQNIILKKDDNDIKREILSVNFQKPKKMKNSKGKIISPLLHEISVDSLDIPSSPITSSLSQIPKSRSSPSLDGSADKYLGIGSLRSESDILVSEDELSGDEYQSAGVIGQITPPRVIQSPTTVRVPTGLTSLFSGPILLSTDSIFSNSAQSNSEQSSDDTSNNIYQLF